MKIVRLSNKKKNLLHYVRFFVGNSIRNLTSKILDKTVLREPGVTLTKRDKQIIVSLTSFPGRIGIVHKCIKTLLNQTLKPDHLFLCLAREQFPLGEESLPQHLLELRKFGLEIIWYSDIRSYKKLIPIYKDWHDHIVVTVDDDNYYSRNWLKKLYNGYVLFPDCIQCNVVQKFFVKKDVLYFDSDLRDYFKDPSYNNCLIGWGGVLYPPNCLHSEVLNEDVFRNVAPSNDDLWFWIMACLKDTKVRVIKNRNIWSYQIKETKGTGLAYENVVLKDDGPFFNQMSKLLDLYPQVLQKLNIEK